MSLAKSIKQLGSETLVYGIAGTFTSLINVFLIPLYTRVFSPSDYGVIAIITSLVGLLSTLVVLGLDNSSARWFYDSDQLDRRKAIISAWFWCQLIVSVLITTFVILGVSQIGQLLALASQYTILIVLAVLKIPLTTFPRVLGNLLRYQRRPWHTTIFTIAVSLGTVLAIILFVLVWQRGLVGLYTAQLLAAGGAAILAIFLLADWIAPRHFSLDVLKPMLIFGLPLIPAAIASWVTQSSDRLILQAFSTMEEVGLYSIANSVASVVALGTAAFQMAWGPFAFSIYKEANADEVYNKVLSVYAWFGCWVCTGVALFAPLLLKFFTTPQYYSAASSVSFLAFSFWAIGISYIISIGCAIEKKSTPIAASIFVGAGVNILLNFILIPIFGRNGAAFATFAAYAVAAVYLYFQSQRYHPITYNIKIVLVCLFVSWLFILVNHLLVSNLAVNSLISSVILCLLFVPLGIWLRVFQIGDIRRVVTLFGGN